MGDNRFRISGPCLDIKIADKNVMYDINIPAGYDAELVPVSGQVQIPNSKTQKGQKVPRN